MQQLFQKAILLFSLTLILFQVWAQNSEPEILISTYLGNSQRNYYGNRAPEKLDLIWKTYLGEGMSPAYGKEKIWKGAGWTGQPLYVRESGGDFLIQPAFDYNLKKLNAKTGELIWQYAFDDILKGSPMLWVNRKADYTTYKYVIIQGSRRGVENKIDDKYIPSLRAISYLSGKEFWQLNVRQTLSYSRDVDGTALVVNDTAYLALENGIFTVFDPRPENIRKRWGKKNPEVFQEIFYYEPKDTLTHGSNLECESSPTLFDGRIYTASGSGRVYGYNLAKRDTDWVFEIGCDLNGSMPLTHDSCLLVPVEKDYITGAGGLLKLDPRKPPKDAIVWYFPTHDKKWFHWNGGIVGSAGISDSYQLDKNYAAFVAVDGYLYVVEHDVIDENFRTLYTDGSTYVPTPKLIYKEYVGGTISTPIIVEDKLVVALDNGINLYQLSGENVRLLDRVPDLEIDATPIAIDGRIYIASRDGYLYCFGEK